MLQVWLLAAFPVMALILMVAAPPKARPWFPVVATGLNLIDFATVLIRAPALEADARHSWFQVDPLSLTVLGITLFVGFTASLYSVRYLRLEGDAGATHGRDAGGLDPGVAVRPASPSLYYALFLAFYLTLAFAPLFQNVLITWACIEATALTSVLLVDFHRSRTAAEASWKYIILMEFGGIAALFGTLTLLLGEPGGMNAATWSTLGRAAARIPVEWQLAAYALILVGYGTKAGLVPFNAWLPDAHSQAPSPVSAMLSAAKLNTALYAIVRFAGILSAGGLTAFAHGALAALGLLTMAVSTLMTVRQSDFKRLFAYSSSENMGLIALGFAFGPLGVVGALLQMISHSVIKSLLFYQSGDLVFASGSTRMSGLRGFAQAFPWSGGTLVLAFLAIAGAPPFGLFLGEFTIIAALFEAGAPWLAIVVAALLAILFANFTRYAVQIGFGSPSAAVRRFRRSAQHDGVTAGLPFGLHIAVATLLGTVLPGVFMMVGRIPF